MCCNRPLVIWMETQIFAHKQFFFKSNTIKLGIILWSIYNVKYVRCQGRYSYQTKTTTKDRRGHGEFHNCQQKQQVRHQTLIQQRITEDRKKKEELEHSEVNPVCLLCSPHVWKKINNACLLGTLDSAAGILLRSEIPWPGPRWSSSTGLVSASTGPQSCHSWTPPAWSCPETQFHSLTPQRPQRPRDIPPNQKLEIPSWKSVRFQA